MAIVDRLKETGGEQSTSAKHVVFRTTLKFDSTSGASRKDLTEWHLCRNCPQLSFASVYMYAVLQSEYAAYIRQACPQQPGVTVAQERTVRLKALECLAGILHCMVEWSHEFCVNPISQSNLGTLV